MTIDLEIAKPIFEAVREYLTTDDDRRLWRTALGHLVDEFLHQRSVRPRNRECVLMVGACRHWVRPHQSRWTAAGGFAWPEGYRNANPELDWKVILNYRGGCWERLEKLPGKGSVALTVAIPTRTARHNQAAVHTKWSTSQQPVLFGFKKIRGEWECVAVSDEAENGRVVVGTDDVEMGTADE